MPKKSVTKKKKTVAAKPKKHGVAIGVGAVAATALAIAGGYVLWEKMGKQKQIKVKAWVAKARKEAIQNIGKAKHVGQSEYARIVTAAVKRYGASGKITKEELAAVARELVAEWKNVRGHADAIAKQLKKQKKGSMPAKKAGRARAKK